MKKLSETTRQFLRINENNLNQKKKRQIVHMRKHSHLPLKHQNGLPLNINAVLLDKYQGHFIINNRENCGVPNN